MRDPIVSLIMPTYNRADMIDQTITSILRQTFPDFELIIIDDGSTDVTLGKVLKFTDTRIRYELIEHGEDFGIGALNYGMERARGKYLSFVSSDNIYFSNYLKVLLEGLDDSEVDFIYGNFLNFQMEDSMIEEFSRPIHLDGQLELHHLAIGYTVGICFLYTRTLFDKVKPYRPGPHSDYDLVVRMAIAGAKFLRLDSLLGINVVHSGQLSETSRKMDDEKEIRLMMCKYLKKIKYKGAGELERRAISDWK